jgi:hypothetical protein
VGGVLADQAALYGVLAEAEALGLELIEVRRLPPPAAAGRAAGAIVMRPLRAGRGNFHGRRRTGAELSCVRDVAARPG